MQGVTTERRREALPAAHGVSCTCPWTTTARTSTQCSGGERQRVALARALAFDPEILFFDEPLSAIDYRLRKTLEKELKDIHRETGKTFVYITHSLEEAMVMSDRIGIMRAGELVQVGTPDQIYNRPSQPLRLRVHGRGQPARGETARRPDGELHCPSLGQSLIGPDRKGRAFAAGTWSSALRTCGFFHGSDSAENSVRGTLYNEYALGSRIQYQVQGRQKSSSWSRSCASSASTASWTTRSPSAGTAATASWWPNDDED